MSYMEAFSDPQTLVLIMHVDSAMFYVIYKKNATSTVSV